LINVNEVLFCPPLVPTQYRDCLVFEEHLKNGFAEAEKITGRRHEIPDVWYQQPIYYKGNRLSFIGNNQDVLWPNYAEYLDIELELAIIISKDGKNISKAEAPNYIFGYSILNDVSARDAQMIEMAGQLGPAKGKDFDTGNILGPYILTADEVSHPASLNMEARVNGQRWGGGNSSKMHHNFADIIAFISKSETLYSGEVIGSGTVGTGCGLEIGKRLEPNDEFELEIENIGILKNKIIKELIDE
jgi:2-keto-4-pentenoate hydratase/2-oxohepta-3-ene-1,7-dioic acid hydratase in catechol pathway